MELVVSPGNLTDLVEWIGTRIPMPMMARIQNMLRHMRITRRKTVASMPMVCISCSSWVLIKGKIHDHGFLPRGGGACLSSTCFSFGAYTD